MTAKQNAADVRALAIALRDALKPPHRAGGWAARDRLIADRAAFIWGALSALAESESANVAAAAETIAAMAVDHPETYAVQGEQDAAGGGE